MLENLIMFKFHTFMKFSLGIWILIKLPSILALKRLLFCFLFSYTGVCLVVCDLQKIIFYSWPSAHNKQDAR